MLFLLLFVGPGLEGTAMDGEVAFEDEDWAKARGFSISTNDFLRCEWEGDGGAPALFESPMLAD